MGLKKKSLSIIDIARQLNISPTTVSFILNGKAKERRISDELSEKVLKFIEEVGYKPNVLARSFRTGKTHTIGLIVENISNPFFANLALYIEEKAYKNGYKILYCSTENDPAKARDLMAMFKDQRIDGYIITPTEGIREDIDALAETGAPVLLFDRTFEGSKHDYVGLNNFESAYKATEHLLQQGYREIGFVTINSLQSQMLQRLLGYEKAIDKYKCRHYVKEIAYSLEPKNMKEHIIEFLKRKSKLDALVFGTNYLGVCGLKAIKQLGYSIPDDIAVISFDDHVLFELYSPGISAIAQPIEAMSEQLINILLEKLLQKKQTKREQVLPGTLIERGSTAKKRK